MVLVTKLFPVCPQLAVVCPRLRAMSSAANIRICHLFHAPNSHVEHEAWRHPPGSPDGCTRAYHEPCAPRGVGFLHFCTVVHSVVIISWPSVIMIDTFQTEGVLPATRAPRGVPACMQHHVHVLRLAFADAILVLTPRWQPWCRRCCFGP